MVGAAGGMEDEMGEADKNMAQDYALSYSMMCLRIDAYIRVYSCKEWEGE